MPSSYTASHDKTILNKRIADTFPDKDYIRKVYEHICYYYQMAVGDGLNCTYEFSLKNLPSASNIIRHRPTAHF